MASSSHNRPIQSVIGGASNTTHASDTNAPLMGPTNITTGPAAEEGAYKPSTGADKSLVCLSFHSVVLRLNLKV